MINQLFTFKAQSLYGAYAPDDDVCVYGACMEEAVNGLADELRAREAAALASRAQRRGNGRD